MEIEKGADGVQYGFVCVVTGAQQPVGQAIITELAGKLDFCARMMPVYGFKWENFV